jgi:hypothetical protein
MPTVYGPPKVAAQALQGRLTTAPSLDSGQGASRALMEAGAAIYKEETDRQDAVAIMAAESKLSTWETERLYNPEKGALGRRGKDAFGIPDEIDKDLTDTIGKIRGELGNDRQRMEFDRRADVKRTISKHVFAESRKFDDAETDNFLANSRRAAEANFSDPDRVGLEIARQVDAVTAYAARNGLGSEYVKAKRAGVEAATHTAVIERFLANGMDQSASEYYERNKSSIGEAGDATKIEGKLMVAVTEGKGLRAADDIWKAHHKGGDLDPVNIDAMREEAAKKFASDPKLYKATMDAIKERANLHKAAQSERAEANSGAVWRKVFEGANLATIARTPEFLALPGNVQAQVKEHVVNWNYQQGQRARTLTAQGDEDAARKNFAEYLTIVGDPAKLASMSPDAVVALLPRLGRTLTAQVMEKHNTLVKDANAVREATIDDNLFKTLAHEAGLKPYDNGLSDDRKADLGRLRNAVEQEIAAEERAVGKKLTRDRKAAIMREAVDKKVAIDVLGPDRQVPAAMVRPDERGDAYVPIDKVPDGTVTTYLNTLRSKGVIAPTVSDAAARVTFESRISRAYALRLMGASRAEIDGALMGTKK